MLVLQLGLCCQICNNTLLFEVKKTCFLDSKTYRVSAEHDPELTHDIIGGCTEYLFSWYKNDII